MMFIVISIALLFSVGIYVSRSNPYKLAATNKNVVLISNPLPLQEVLPQKVYDFILARLTDYATTSNPHIASMSITSAVTNDSGDYSFSFVTLPGNSPHEATIRVTNVGGNISSVVLIDGTVQTYDLQNSATTTFDNLSDLLQYGITDEQVNNLEAAISKFSPEANKVSVDLSQLSLKSDTDGNLTIHFLVTIDSQTYSAVMQYSGTSSIRLYLYGQGTTQQLYDSRVIDT
jgi:hypothetical protein